MRYLSVCAGIEAATVAWKRLGWEAVGFSEISRFPSAVLAHHYPDITNYGDMTNYEQWRLPDFDVLVGGTPCQSFSVAGLRQGLDDPRGNLALTFCGILSRYRPKRFVWENVPGVLSSNGGRDFGAFIGAVVKLGYGIAYRVLDAQYFGVPQRRRRVFVVGYLGDWRRAVEVLFEPACFRRDPPPRREAGQRVAAPLTAGSAAGSNAPGRRREDDVNLTVAARDGAPLIPDVANPLTQRMHKGINTTADEGQTPIVVHATQDPDVSDIAHPLQEKNGGRVNAVAFAQNQRDEVRLMDKAGALSAEPGAKQQTYVFKGGAGAKAGGIGGDEHVAPTLSASPSGTQQAPTLMQDLFVRRLTPLECERLQGFPDNYTNIPGASDSARYRALGNSMAVPVMHWIGKRIDQFTQRG